MGQLLLAPGKVFVRKSPKQDGFDESEFEAVIMRQVPFFYWTSHGYVCSVNAPAPIINDCLSSPLLEDILKNQPLPIDLDEKQELYEDELSLASEDLDCAAYDAADDFDPSGLENEHGHVILCFATSVLVWNMAEQDSQDEEAILLGFKAQAKKDDPHAIICCQSQAPS